MPRIFETQSHSDIYEHLFEIIKNDGIQLYSGTYRGIFEFIKKEGTGPLVSLVKDLDDLKCVERDEIVSKRIFQNRDLLAPIMKKNKLAVNLLRQFKNEFLNRVKIDSDEFADFINTVSSSADNIDHFIENAKLLESLKVGIIRICENPVMLANCFHKTIIHRNDKKQIIDIVKSYSDGNIDYEKVSNSKSCLVCEEYKNLHDNTSWVMVAHNNLKGDSDRYAYLRNFGFDASKLPSEEELNSLNEPESFKVYKKELHESGLLPF